MASSTTLREWAYDRVETAVGGQLGSDGGITYATVAASNDDLDPRVSVGASLSGSDRENLRQVREGRVRVIVDGTESFAQTDGTLALTDIQHTLEDELTKHEPPWGARGLRRMDEVAWDESVNRFVGVQEWAVERSSIHPHY